MMIYVQGLSIDMIYVHAECWNDVLIMFENYPIPLITTIPQFT